MELTKNDFAELSDAFNDTNHEKAKNSLIKYFLQESSNIYTCDPSLESCFKCNFRGKECTEDTSITIDETVYIFCGDKK